MYIYIDIYTHQYTYEAGLPVAELHLHPSTSTHHHHTKGKGKKKKKRTIATMAFYLPVAYIFRSDNVETWFHIFNNSMSFRPLPPGETQVEWRASLHPSRETIVG